jgi:hypothetical protein
MKIFGLDIYPSQRMHEDFPWAAWALGWLCFIKASFWLFTEITVPNGWFWFVIFALKSLAFLVAGVGIWNLRRWGLLTALITAAVDIVVTVIFNYLLLQGTVEPSFNVVVALTGFFPVSTIYGARGLFNILVFFLTGPVPAYAIVLLYGQGKQLMTRSGEKTA